MLERLASKMLVGSCVLLSFVGWAAAQSPPHSISDYVALGVFNPGCTGDPTVNCTPSGAQSEKVTIGDRSFIAEGNIGVNDKDASNGSPKLPTSLNFGNFLFMADGSAAVSDIFKPGASTGPDSLFDLFTLSSYVQGSCPGPSSSCPVQLRDPTPPKSGYVQLGSMDFPLVVPSPLPDKFGPLTADISFAGVNCPGDIKKAPRGSYKDITVPQQCTLELTGDPAPSSQPTPALSNVDYEFANLVVGTEAHVVIDHPTTINIKSKGSAALTLNEWSTIGPQNPFSNPTCVAGTLMGASCTFDTDCPGSTCAYQQEAVNPSDIQVNTTCGVSLPGSTCSNVTFNYASHAAISLYAPYAQVNLRRSFRGKGRYVGNIVNGQETVQLRAATTDPSPPQTTYHTRTQEQFASVDPTSFVFAPVTVGAPCVRSLTIGDVAALQCFLPTYGDPMALCGVDHDACSGSKILPQSCDGIAGLPQSKTMTVTSPCGPIGDGIVSGAHSGQGGGTLTGQAIAAKLNVLNDSTLGDFVLPTCLCTDKCSVRGGTTITAHSCRLINNTNQQQQGAGGGLEDGLTTVNDLIAFADEALSTDCGQSGTCTQTCSTALAPPDPVRIGEIAWALQAINECFSDPSGADVAVRAASPDDCVTQPATPNGCCGTGVLCGTQCVAQSACSPATQTCNWETNTCS